MATATRPTPVLATGDFPNAAVIAEAWNRTGNAEYFHMNPKHGFHTFQDQEIGNVSACLGRASGVWRRDDHKGLLALRIRTQRKRDWQPDVDRWGHWSLRTNSSPSAPPPQSIA